MTVQGGPGQCGGCGHCSHCRAQRFSDPTAMEMSRTLGQRLICTADSLRDLFTQFGLRPYKVRLVRVRWAAGERGVGVPLVEHTLDILPTPLLQDLTAVTEVVNPVGLDEIGSVLVSEISGRFTEEELRFLLRDGTPPGPDEEIFWEIEFPRTDGYPSIKRRFFMRSAPFYSAGQFQWQVRLERAHEDRARTGEYE